MSFYEGPSSDPELMKLTRQQPAAIQEAMLQTLRAGRWSGYINPTSIFPRWLTVSARQCSESASIHAAQLFRRPGGQAVVPDHLARAGIPITRRLGIGSVQRLAAANDVIETWADDRDAEPGDKARMFARWHERSSAQGYEVTTIRHRIGGGPRTGTVYR